MKYTIENLIETERGKLKFDAADFLVSLESGKKINGKISARGILVSGILGGNAGYYIGKDIFGENGAIICSAVLAGIGMYFGYKLQKDGTLNYSNTIQFTFSNKK